MPAAVLALDQGTTGTTAIVFDREGAVLGRAYSEFEQFYPAPGWVEHDPEEIWRVTCEVGVRALESAGITRADLYAIGLTNQRETSVLWNRRTAEPIHRAVVWQSRQTSEICQALVGAGHAELFRARTGLPIDPYFSGTKIRWLLDRYPEAARMARDGEVVFGTIDTWLLWKLTGGAVHATEPTNASRTLLYDIHHRRWDPDLLSVLDVPPALLPDVRPSCGVFGETAGQSGLPPGVPIAGMAGDQQAALFGQHCWARGQAKNTYGTGCFVVMNMGPESPISRHGLLTTICCDGSGAPAYALEGAIFVAGATIQWLRDELGLISHAAETEQIAHAVPDTRGVYLVPAFAGLGAPYWDADARGAIVGLTRGAGRHHLVRAALESLAYQTRDVIEAMNADSGIPITELKVDGGASANNFLMQFQADLLGVPVDRPALVETTAMGAAFLAGLGAGLWKSSAELAGVRQRERLFQPRLAPAARERLYDGWRAAVRQVLSHGS